MVKETFQICLGGWAGGGGGGGMRPVSSPPSSVDFRTVTWPRSVVSRNCGPPSPPVPGLLAIGPVTADGLIEVILIFLNAACAPIVLSIRALSLRRARSGVQHRCCHAQPSQ